MYFLHNPPLFNLRLCELEKKMMNSVMINSLRPIRLIAINQLNHISTIKPIASIFPFYLKRNQCQTNQTQSFHCTRLLLAKKGGGGKGGKKGSDSDGPEIPLPNIKDYDTKMNNTLSKLTEQFNNIRIGRPSNNLFDHIKISHTSISELSQISLTNQSQVNISVFDPINVQAIVTAIKVCPVDT